MNLDIPAGFPVDRQVHAEESLERWGPLLVFDANGNQINNTFSVCVMSGEVIIYAYDIDGVFLRNPMDPSRLLEVPIKYSAPLSVRPAK